MIRVPLAVAAVSRYSVAIPVKPEIFFFEFGPTRTICGSPPSDQASARTFFRWVTVNDPPSVVSVGEATVPEEKPGVVPIVLDPTEVLLPAIHDSVEASERA